MNDLFAKIRSLALGERILFFVLLLLVITIVLWVLDFVLSFEFLGFAIMAYVVYQLFIKKD